VTHKALLEAETWDDYVQKVLQYPMQRLNYGEDPFTIEGSTKMVTVRLKADTYERANEVRGRLNRTWRHMILEPSDRDKVRETIQWFESQSSIMPRTEVAHFGQEP